MYYSITYRVLPRALSHIKRSPTQVKASQFTTICSLSLSFAFIVLNTIMVSEAILRGFVWTVLPLPAIIGAYPLRSLSFEDLAPPEGDGLVDFAALRSGLSEALAAPACAPTS